MRTVTEVWREPIEHASAWTSRSIGGKQGLVYELSPKHLDAIDALLARTRHLAPQKVVRKDFDHALLNPVLAELDREIRYGRGAVIITGVTRERYSEEDCERLYWGFGTHWGLATTVQSRFGDLLGHVRREEDNSARGYRGAQELEWHTDSHEVVGLMCLQKARSGGLSRFASAAAIHNEILRTRPELLEPLYAGYRILPVEQQYVGGDPISAYRVPVFSNVDGVVSCNYVRGQFERAAKALGESLPAELVEALDTFDSIASRSDFHLEFMLEPGEIFMVNNWTGVHSRTAFEDDPGARRHLLRLWLSVPDGRPVIRALLERGAGYNRAHAAQLEKEKVMLAGGGSQ